LKEEERIRDLEMSFARVLIGWLDFGGKKKVLLGDEKDL